MFIAIDGDLVGHKIEALILNENLKALSGFNKMVSGAILKIEMLIKGHGGKVFLSGGDNIFAYDPSYSDTVAFICATNKDGNGLRFSVGFGSNIKLAYLALRFAKQSRSGRVAHAFLENNEINVKYH